MIGATPCVAPMPRLSRRDHALIHLTRDAVFRRRLLEQRRLCGITGHRKETARVETAARRPRARLPRPGYWGDPGDTPYTYNFKQLKPSEYDGGPVSILQLPKEYVAINKAMGKWSDDPISASMMDQSGGCSWMRPVPYSREAEAAIPVGTPPSRPC